MYQTLKKLLCDTPSVSGRERGVRELIASLMQPLCDEIKVDAMGNLICRKAGSGKAPKKVLLVHGDPEAMEWMRGAISTALPEAEVLIPQPGKPCRLD